MRKLKLHMQISLDGFSAGPEGQLDWMTWNQDEKLKKLTNDLTDSSDTIILGRKMTGGFIAHWENVVNNQPENPDISLAQKMVNMEKIVFSKTVKKIAGKNTRVENGDLVNAINALKGQNGKDIVVYGGVNFVSELIKNNLIDEFNLFVNPTAIGNGLRIFSNNVAFELINSTAYSCGVVVNQLKPVNK